MGRSIEAGKAFVRISAKDNASGTLDRISKKMRAFGSQTMSLGRNLASTAAVAGTPFALATKEFATFEKTMSRVAALTGATGADFSALEDRARDLGRTTRFAADEAAQAMSFFALAGFDTQKILKAINPTLDLAAAGQMDIADAADIVAKSMAGMGIEADQVGNVVDVMAKAMTTANTDLMQLGDAMKFVGPVARATGKSLEETISIIQVLSNAGIQAEMAGSSLRGILLAMGSPSNEAAATMKSLGIQVADAAGNMLPMADIVDQFNAALAGMGSQEQLNLLGRIFPARQVTGMTALLGAGGDALRAFQTANEEAAGTGARIAGKQIDNLAGSFTILISAVKDLAIETASAFAGPLRDFVEGATSASNAISEWVKNNQAIVLAIVSVIVGVGALGAGLIALGAVISLLGFALAGLSALASVTFATLATVVAALTSPVALVVAAFGMLIAIWAQVTESGQQTVSFLSELFGRLGTIISETFEGASAALKNGDIQLAASIATKGITLLWLEATEDIRRFWIELKQVVTNVWLDMLAAMQGPLDKFIDGFADVIGNAASEYANFLTSIGLGGERAERVIRLGRAAVDALQGPGKDFVSQDVEEARDAANQAYAKDLEGIGAEIDRTEKEFRALQDAARAIREPEATEGGPSLPTPKAVDTLFEGADSIQQEVAKVTSRGAFSAVAAGLLGGNTVERQQLDEAKKTNKSLEKIERNTEDAINTYPAFT